MKRFLIVLIALMALLSACGEPAPTSGRVDDKDFTAEHWEGGYYSTSEWRYSCESTSRYNYNTKTYDYYQDCGMHNVPVQRWEDHHIFRNDRWRLHLKSCKTNDKGEEKCHSGWRDVTQDEYDRHQFGDFYPKTNEHANGS